MWRPRVGDTVSPAWYSGSGSDSDNQICIIVYADLRGCVAGNGREGLWQSDAWGCVWEKFYVPSCWIIWHLMTIFTHHFSRITRYVLNVECHVTFVLTSYDLLEHTLISSLAQKCGWWVKAKIEWKSDMSWPPSIHLGQLCDASVMIIWWRYWLPECYRQEIIQRSKVTQEEPRYEGRVILFLSGRLVNVTWLPDIHPSCWIMSVTGSKRPCVDLWSRLTSSIHLCKCAWLGHCMITWPCCRFITLSSSSRWGFLSCVKHILAFFPFFAKK